MKFVYWFIFITLCAAPSMTYPSIVRKVPVKEILVLSSIGSLGYTLYTLWDWRDAYNKQQDPKTHTQHLMHPLPRQGDSFDDQFVVNLGKATSEPLIKLKRAAFFKSLLLSIFITLGAFYTK